MSTRMSYDYYQRPSVSPPQIGVIGEAYNNIVITSNTYIELVSSNHLHKVFFTADGSEPLPSSPETHRYYSPFRLLPGNRIIKAISCCRTTGQISNVAIKTFEVVSPNDNLIAESDVDSSSSFFSTSDYDVGLPPLPYARKDQKTHREQTYRHHRQLKPVQEVPRQPAPTSPSPPRPAELQQREYADQDSRGMRVHNGSGTQINYWGAVDPNDDFFQNGHVGCPGKPSVVKSSRQAEAFASAPRQQPSVVEAQMEPKQNFSIRKFFPGWFSNDKEKSKDDSRETVNIVTEKDAGHFKKIKSNCLKKKSLWADPDFPCNDKSLYYNEKPVEGKIEWKRPTEICSSPHMFVKGADRFDIEQGALGNCWLLAAISTLTTDSSLLDKVVPRDQDFKKNYAGIFRFYFWQYGNWVEVLIDDRLPTCSGQLIYMHSSSGNEFWSALVEKAYAKLVGCYENLVGGTQSESLTDLTGGLAEVYNFREDLPSNMFKLLYRAQKNSSLMGCSIDAIPGEDQQEEQLDNGLVIGHAYSITAVKLMEDEDGGRVELIRCRNPWGNEFEWRGAWADGSPEWNDIAEEDQKQVGLVKDHDGEFWMSYKDFAANFTRVEICHIKGNDERHPSKGRTMSGSWKKKTNAGGCRNHPKTYPSNPQYHVELVDVDEDDEDELCTMIVALMQKNRRNLRKEGGNNLIIGYDIYQSPTGDDTPLSSSFLSEHAPVASSPTYINQREVVGRHQLEPGHYFIVPTTFEPNQEADFILRIFTEGYTQEVTEANVRTGAVHPQRAAPAVRSAPQHHGMQKAEDLLAKYGGEDKEIDAYELQRVLNESFSKTFKFDPFDIQTCKTLVAMVDSDMTGKLNLEEFKTLWADLQKWADIFREFDKDLSGKFSSLELRDALEKLGYKLSNGTFSAVAARWGDKSGEIDFDNFVGCVTKLKTHYSIFYTKEKGGKAEFTMDEFIQMTVYS